MLTKFPDPLIPSITIIYRSRLALSLSLSLYIYIYIECMRTWCNGYDRRKWIQ